MARRFTRRRWRRPQRLTLEGPPPARRKDVVVSEQMTLEPSLMWQDNRRRLAVIAVGFLAFCGVEGAVVASLLSMPWVVLLALAFGGLYLLVGWRAGDRWILAVLGADADAPARARSFVDAFADAPTRVLVAPGEAPNAIAISLHRRAIVLTDGAMALPDLELEALIAHEIVHVRGGDATLASVYAILAGAVELGAKRRQALIAIPVWPACVAVRALARFSAPREREERADVGGALLTRYPPGMRRALLALAVEHSDSTLRITDAFWTAPRAPGGVRELQHRAERVGEM